LAQNLNIFEHIKLILFIQNIHFAAHFAAHRILLLGAAKWEALGPP
jgi:hypothetical protein